VEPHRRRAAGPARIRPQRLFEFIGRARLSVILVSVHARHTFNRPLIKLLRREHPDIALGVIGLSDLMMAGGTALRFLHQGLRGCGAPATLGIVPGYLLFRGGEMLAWDAGIPTFADIDALARSGLLGALWSGVTRDLSFVGQALHLASEQIAANRVAARFRAAAAQEPHHRAASGAAGGAADAPPAQDVYWAYQLLGVLPTATDREVHEAWRKRRMDVHPDQAAHDPAEFARRSAVSAEINKARDMIMEHRGKGPRAARAARAS